MSHYSIRLKADHNFIMALCDSAESANRYLTEAPPDYVARGFLADKTLKATDFEVAQHESYRSAKMGWFK